MEEKESISSEGALQSMETEYKLSENMILCNFCHRPVQIIWVHGHGQCAFCHENIDECCQGEQACDSFPPEK